MRRSRALFLRALLLLIAYTPCTAGPAESLDVPAFRAAVLKQHNTYRASHGVPPLALSTPLNQVAQHYAEQLARSNRLVHSGHAQYGENLYTFRSSNHAPPSPATVVERWYNERASYNYAQPGFQGRTGHFTQVVWKASTTLGIGIAQAVDGTWYVVSNYYPPGNIAGHFPTNVLPPRR
ncbi:MAG: CAP family protein [Candidatus Tectimicrobiota bacterium]